jgi:anti-anti-sigma factor
MIIQTDSFTINQIRTIYQTLLDEFNSSSKLLIDLRNVDEIDLSGLQLLVSLKKSCLEKNKEFYIKNLKEELLYSFELSGLDSYLEV